MKSTTVVQDDPKAPFSEANSPRCWGGCVKLFTYKLWSTESINRINSLQLIFSNIDMAPVIVIRGQGGFRGVVTNEMDCRIVICQFELQSCYNIHFMINALANEPSELWLKKYHFSKDGSGNILAKKVDIPFKIHTETIIVGRIFFKKYFNCNHHKYSSNRHVDTGFRISVRLMTVIKRN